MDKDYLPHVDFDAMPMLGSSFDILSLQETYMGGIQEIKAADVERKFITDGWWAVQTHPDGQQVHHSGSFPGERLHCKALPGPIISASKCLIVCMQKENFTAVVPGTVLTTLIHNGIYPDPDIGLNQSKIPDIYHAGSSFYTYWFCNTINILQSRSLRKEARARLILHGINYSAR